MKTYGEVDMQIHVFLTSALVGVDWSVSRPGSFIPGERTPGTHWIVGWVGSRTYMSRSRLRRSEQKDIFLLD
jgi:hypothetical protein